MCAGAAGANIDIAVAPTLNCNDLPEASVWPVGRGPLRKCAAPRAARKFSKHRVKVVRLPITWEVGDASDEECLQVHEQQGWACHVCTLHNHNLLQHCEVCNTQRSKGIDESVQEIAKAPVVGSTPSLDWPALSERWAQVQEDAADSWIDCDVSSVASSWQDVGGADEHVDKDDADNEADVVLLNESCVHAQEPKLTGSPLWSAIVGKQAAVTASSPPAFAMPRAFTRTLAARSRTKVADEEVDTVLDELESRRMLGTTRGCGRKR